MTRRLAASILGLLLFGGCLQQPSQTSAPDTTAASSGSAPEPDEQTPTYELPPTEPQMSADAEPLSPAPAGSDPEQAAAEIQTLGGEVMRNNTPGNPIYGVRVTGKKPDVAALVAVLERLDQLQELSLDRAELTDADLPALGKLTRITTLDLSGNAITDAGLAHLKPLARLGLLRLSQNEITDAGLPHLKEFQHLKKLFLGRNPITDEGLIHLKDLPALEELNLSGCTDLTDAAFMHVAEIPKLKEVWLSFTRVTDPGVAAFQQKRPRVTVEK